ncbi:hypothetical protein C7B82_09250 [Stenomitos frigidus ULC18]|uniref:Uncharacterized protein n=1 Tax=Stenomitos frigidus ULC18 TaxID=2107698 RepID=A0A2T1EC25_9CYAN|nr:hypothetical protein C7B82_09250 [Stenomitos frigidus ULC18]
MGQKLLLLRRKRCRLVSLHRHADRSNHFNTILFKNDKRSAASTHLNTLDQYLSIGKALSRVDVTAGGFIGCLHNHLSYFADNYNTTDFNRN